MSILRTLILVAITFRLLLPPGICVCKLSSPVAQLLILMAGSESSHSQEDDEDHHPGCPASGLTAGLGVQPVTPSVTLPALSHDIPPVLAFDLVTSPPCDQSRSLSEISQTPPLYLSQCALRI